MMHAFMTEILLLGLGVGILVGLMGVGGGIVLVPALVYLLRFEQHLAQGTSLLLQLPPIGIGALVFYWRKKRVDLRVGLICAAGFLVGGYFGSDVALGISQKNLQGLFGVFLMVAAALLLRQAQRPPAPPLHSDEAQT
jgi:hypothetical protein